VTTFHIRRLPHYHSIDHPTFITWRLAGSLPASRRLEPITAGEDFLAMDRLLDAATTGPLYLRSAEVAKLVVDAIYYRNGAAYELHNYVVMAKPCSLAHYASYSASEADTVA
jgi:hypothetical protein